MQVSPPHARSPRYDFSETPLPQALAHEARRVFGDRLRGAPAATAAFERAFLAALERSGLKGVAGAAGGAGAKEYYTTLGTPAEERLRAAAAGEGPKG
jgi:hypothetical protein